MGCGQSTRLQSGSVHFLQGDSAPFEQHGQHGSGHGWDSTGMVSGSGIHAPAVAHSSGHWRHDGLLPGLGQHGQHGSSIGLGDRQVVAMHSSGHSTHGFSTVGRVQHLQHLFLAASML